MNEPVIWIVDSEQWPRAALRAELIERGYDAVGHFLLSEAWARLRADQPHGRPDAIVLELRGQETSTILRQELAQSLIPLVILGGAVELSDPSIREYKQAAILRRPVTIGEIADLIEKIVPARQNHVPRGKDSPEGL